jgi:hypothetical protein
MQVQFGSNAAAAEAFMQTCSSIGTLVAAWPSLQQLLLGKQSGKTSDTNIAISIDDSCDTEEPDGRISSSAYEQQQQQCDLLEELYTVSAELCDLHAPPDTPHTMQQQQQRHDDRHGDAEEEDAAAVICTEALEAQRTNSPSKTADGTATAEQAAALPADLVQQASSNTPAAATAVQSKALVQLPQPAPSTAAQELMPQASQNAVAAAAGVADADAQVQVLPLPYAHYSLVRADGRPLERPDKHPFSLSRVVYDPRWGCHKCCCRFQIKVTFLGIMLRLKGPHRALTGTSKGP